METDKYTIAPGNVYKYCCDNDQGYGYMVPVRTSDGWDFIDTYHLDIPMMKTGETSDEASVRRITELGFGEHDGYVRDCLRNFYYCNAYFHNKEVPRNLTLMFNVNDYDITSRRNASDFDDDNVVMDVPMYMEQHFDWNSGKTLGLCFVRKGAEKSQTKEFRNLLNEANNLIVKPSAESASFLLEEAKKKLNELENAGLSTPQDELEFDFLVRKTEIINKCAEDLKKAFGDHLTQIRNSDSLDKEEKENNVN